MIHMHTHRIGIKITLSTNKHDKKIAPKRCRALSHTLSPTYTRTQALSLTFPLCFSSFHSLVFLLFVALSLSISPLFSYSLSRTPSLSLFYLSFFSLFLSLPLCFSLSLSLSLINLKVDRKNDPHVFSLTRTHTPFFLFPSFVFFLFLSFSLSFISLSKVTIEIAHTHIHTLSLTLSLYLSLSVALRCS